jgi:chromatin structure-remodeling complex subunit RSC1/2
MQHIPVSTPPVEAGPPGVNQFTTPAALARPRSPDPGVVADRLRTAAMDKQFIDRFDANLEQWRGPEIQLPPGRKTAGIEGSGWFGQGAPEYEMRNGGSSSWPGRISSVLHAVTEYRDAR